MDYGSETMGYIWTINSGMTFFFWHNCKADTHIFFYVYLNFLPVLHIVNSLKITKTLVYSVLTKMRYKKQNWMQGQHNGKIGRFIQLAKISTNQISLLQGQGCKPRHPCVSAHE